MTVVIYLVNLIFDLFVILVVVNVVMGFAIQNPYHPARMFLNRIIEPFLAPIRKLLPQGGVLDFSPMVLILVLLLVQYLIMAILRSF